MFYTSLSMFAKMDNCKSICIAMFLFAFFVPLHSQVIHPTSGTVNQIVTCGTTLGYVDSGKPTFYNSSENGTMVFCPDVVGQRVSMTFNFVDIESSPDGTGNFAGNCCGDVITISDANGVLFEGCGEDDGDGDDACGNTVGENGPNDLQAGDTFSSTAADGCLTINFQSDETANEVGWEAILFCTTPTPPSIPTMGEWGLIILALMVLCFATVFMMRRQTAVAGMGNVSMSGTGGIPFDKNSYGKMLIAVMIGLAVLFAVAMSVFGYEMTNADVPGSLIAGPIFAYLLHLVIGKK